MSEPDCIFCKIINGDIPSLKIYETDHIFGFMDIQPLSEGHCLFVPKDHADKLHQTNDLALQEILIAIKKVTKALGIENYNILQNNGDIAHQAVNHTHFHLIPKPSEDKGLKIMWEPLSEVDQTTIADQITNSL